VEVMELKEQYVVIVVPQERVCDGAQLEFLNLHLDESALLQTRGQSDPKSWDC
nr:hypothetical protein [Tanacetum cinerariifolium]